MKHLLAGLWMTCAVLSAEDTPVTDWGRIRAYAAAGMILSRGDAGYSKQSPFLGFTLDKNWRTGEMLLLNSFFETRLTSIPAADDQAGFVASRKVASLAGGFYAPVLTTRWTFGGIAQSLFLAPLVRAAMETPMVANTSHFYTATGAGARLGHFHMSGSSDSAPELISYVDILYGKYTSFADSHRRLGIEGLLKAPGTPIVVGFSANLGSSGAARDDLRFFFGTRFDLGSLIRKLKQ